MDKGELGSWTYTLVTSAEIAQEEFRRFLRREPRKLRPEGMRWGTDRVAGYEGRLWKPNHSYVSHVLQCASAARRARAGRGPPSPPPGAGGHHSKLGGEPPRTFILIDLRKRHWPSRWIALKFALDLAEHWGAPMVVEGGYGMSKEIRQAYRRGESVVGKGPGDYFLSLQELRELRAARRPLPRGA